jgi:hypothetical protein
MCASEQSKSAIRGISLEGDYVVAVYLIVIGLLGLFGAGALHLK